MFIERLQLAEGVITLIYGVGVKCQSWLTFGCVSTIENLHL